MWVLPNLELETTHSWNWPNYFNRLEHWNCFYCKIKNIEIVFLVYIPNQTWLYQASAEILKVHNPSQQQKQGRREAWGGVAKSPPKFWESH